MKHNIGEDRGGNPIFSALRGSEASRVHHAASSQLSCGEDGGPIQVQHNVAAFLAEMAAIKDRMEEEERQPE